MGTGDTISPGELDAKVQELRQKHPELFGYAGQKANEIYYGGFYNQEEVAAEASLKERGCTSTRIVPAPKDGTMSIFVSKEDYFKYVMGNR